MDGTEISQFTYFQQCGGIEVDIVSAELTYGLDRIGMMIQGRERVQDLIWSAGGSGQAPVTWADLWLQNEREFSRYNFEEADVAAHFEMFKTWEREALRLLDLGLVMPGYDAVIKCSHLFNVLDARGAISVSERVGTIGRVRKLARRAAVAYVEQRRSLGWPMLVDPAEREHWTKLAAEQDARVAAQEAGRAAKAAKAASKGAGDAGNAAGAGAAAAADARKAPSGTRGGESSR
jgi:glycyl-tRNA synthetase alpha chain